MGIDVPGQQYHLNRIQVAAEKLGLLIPDSSLLWEGLADILEALVIRSLHLEAIVTSPCVCPDRRLFESRLKQLVEMRAKDPKPIEEWTGLPEPPITHKEAR
jgi:hypothetical protein